jgi:hypothetical protein
MSEKRKFWLVWNVNGYPPKFKHDSEYSAIEEAERLAKENPGKEFVVLVAVLSKEALKPIQTNRFTEHCNEIPF